MFFILSKVLLIFLSPFSWILVLFIIGLVIKNNVRRRRLLIASFMLSLLFSNRLILNAFAKAWDIQSLPPATRKYSCAIILGGFSSEDMNEKGYFNSSGDRFISAITIYDQHQAANLLISGGNGSLSESKFVEADYVLMRLKQLHIPESVILIENKSKNTIQNAAYSKDILAKKHLLQPYLLVTSAYHMRRSLLTFKSAGMMVEPYSCDYKAGNEKFSYQNLLPSADTLALWNIYTKEVVGYLVYYVKQGFKN